MVIEVPNAVNARKRLAVLCGRTNYGPYNSLYYSNLLLGHVREYITGNLRQVAQDLGALRYRIFGKNTIHGDWVQKIPSVLRICLDRALRGFPGLCSSLVLEVTKLKEAESSSSNEKWENSKTSIMQGRGWVLLFNFVSVPSAWSAPQSWS
jgi:hypothetical protein